MVLFVVIGPLFLFATLFKPFISFLNRINKIILKRFGFHSDQELPLGYSREEIRIILEQFQRNGDTKKEGREMLQNVFSLSEKPIKYIMRPRSEITAIEVNSPLSAVLKHINDSYSRYPVYKRTLDNIIGFVHMKDVYQSALESKENKKLSELSIIRKVINIPEIRKADEVLLDMRKKHVHLAVVYSEFGIMVGIVTLEDIIESLVGDIQDEFDKPIKGIRRNPDGTYLIDGNMSSELIQKRFRLPLKGHGYTTIGGVIFGLLGREPHIGDELEIGHLYFEVVSISGKRVSRLLLRRNPKKPD
jgi:CBS domain containing-hemolysin-like protein